MTTMNATGLAELDRQVRNLIALGYPALAGLSEAAFKALFAPLRPACERLDAAPDRVPFVVVVTRDLVGPEAAMPLTALKGKAGFIDFKPGGLETFLPLAELGVPEGPVYLLLDVDTGTETLNVTPNDALETIRAQGRTPLTIDEGVALLTQFPERLRKNHCFSLLGSRSGDRRVPALWISQGRPKLGWCWAGNPHTWLGSASCGARLGAQVPGSDGPASR
jgi:hypothetical protein